MMDTKALRASMAAIRLGFVALARGAFTMEPMSASVTPSGTGNLATFRINNAGTERVALRFSVLTRDSGPDGQEINTPANELFVVYPSRLLVETGTSAAVKLQWRGPATVAVEKSFRFVGEQVPLDGAVAKSGGSGVKFMFRYVAGLYVGGPGLVPRLGATVTGSTGPNGESGFLVEIRNTGTRHVIDTNARLTLSGDAPVQLSSQELGDLSGANFLAGKARTAFIPRTEAVVGKNYVAKIDYESSY